MHVMFFPKKKKKKKTKKQNHIHTTNNIQTIMMGPSVELRLNHGTNNSQTHTICNEILTWTGLRIGSKSLHCRVGLLFRCFPQLGRYTSQLVM